MTKEPQVQTQTRLHRALAYAALAIFSISGLTFAAHAGPDHETVEATSPSLLATGPGVDELHRLANIQRADAERARLDSLNAEAAALSDGFAHWDETMADVKRMLTPPKPKPSRGGNRPRPAPEYGQSPNDGLSCIAGHESGGNYRADSGTYRGKYQYSDSTWNNYGGYSRADQAPPDVQERRAQEDYAKGRGQVHQNWPNTSRWCGL